VRTAKGPLHLLLFDEPPADHLVNCRFDEGGADRFSLTVPLAEVRDELLVVANIRIELTDALAEFGSCGRERSKKIQLYDQSA
jgi:hypothetical protein